MLEPVKVAVGWKCSCDYGEVWFDPALADLDPDQVVDDPERMLELVGMMPQCPGNEGVPGLLFEDRYPNDPLCPIHRVHVHTCFSFHHEP